MLPKKHRATTEHVRTIIAKGASKHSKNFSVRFVTKEPPATVAVVISKKVEPTAVGRNKLKRRVKNILRELTFPNNKTFVFYIKKGVHKLNSSEIKKEIRELLNSNI